MNLTLPTIVTAALALAAVVPGARPSTPHRNVPAGQDDDEEPVRDGKWLYTRHCSGCHNDNGDGKGATILQLGLVARDFQQGSFAFGDTPEQLRKTILTGIPGRSPMPSFQGVLTDEEIGLVIEHVRTLMPKRDDTGPKNTEMIVKDRPVIARGKLPPIREGAPETIRGLLIGTPEGMTFEYDVENVNLLGVRIGRFADREDWGGRGGGYLKPLGTLIWDSADLGMHVRLVPVPNGPDLTRDTENHRTLRSTRRTAKGASVTYELRGDGSHSSLVRVEESVSTRLTSFGPALQRVFACGESVSSSYSAQLEYSFDARPVEVAGSAGVWYVHDASGGGVDVLRVETAVPEDNTLPFTTESRSTFSVTCVRVPKWTPELGAQLEKELSK